MKKERPLIEKLPYEREAIKIGRAIISPCTGCKNNTPVILDSEQKQRLGSQENSWPCPKQVLYAQASYAKQAGDQSFNYDGPVYDSSLKGVNPVWPGLPEHQNRYSYVYLAFFEDNVDNYYNTDWDTSKIRCRGPFLLTSTERMWNLFGRIQQGETVIGITSYYFIDGAQFMGYAIEAASWQVATGYKRKIDSNPGKVLSGAPRNIL